jgi:hypothetical protein
MATKKSVWVLFGILVISAWVLGSAIQAGAETLNFKSFAKVFKQKIVPIDDVEGHSVALQVREGAVIFENGEFGWMKSILFRDLIKGAGTAERYITYTFLDKSTIIVHGKGTIQATEGVSSAAKWTGNIIQGMGRFQGITGTMMSSTKILPPERDELTGKTLSEGSLVYTLPSK